MLKEKDIRKALFGHLDGVPTNDFSAKDFAALVPLLIAKQSKILTDTRLAYSQCSANMFFALWTPVNGIMRIGTLLKAWNQNELIDSCVCGQSCRIFSANGSVLSGRNSYNAYCERCGLVQGSIKTFYRIFEQIQKLFDEFKAGPIIERIGFPDRFDWELGLVRGLPRIERPSLVPTDFREVLHRLLDS